MLDKSMFHVFGSPTFVLEAKLQSGVAGVNESNQTITFCAVGAHHQNGIVERRIKELTLIARTLLLHAIWHWPGYITTML